MDAARFSETLVPSYTSTRRHKPEDQENKHRHAACFCDAKNGTKQYASGVHVFAKRFLFAMLNTSLTYVFAYCRRRPISEKPIAL